MEKFKAVEKEMKTKAYSKEGLSAAQKLDPKEKEKLETCQFLTNMVDELDRQIETVEAETESLQANLKKGKKDIAKADRIAELERTTERHKWHQSKLELLLRALENGQVETEQVKDLDESIRYYVENNQEVDFMEDDSIYDDLNLEEEEDLYGLNNEVDRVSSQDAQSAHDEGPDIEIKPAIVALGKQKSAVSDTSTGSNRRPSTHIKSPLPALATLHTPLPPVPNTSNSNAIKTNLIPPKSSVEPLKYASAAAAAAAATSAGEKGGVGIAPLPPPSGVPGHLGSLSGIPPLPSNTPRIVGGASPKSTSLQPIKTQVPATRVANAQGSGEGSTLAHTLQKVQSLSQTNGTSGSTTSNSISSTPVVEKAEKATISTNKQPTSRHIDVTAETRKKSLPGQSTTNGDLPKMTVADESVYHLPSSLHDLIESFGSAKNNIALGPKPADERLLSLSHATCPESIDAERPRHYRPQNPYPYTPAYYPQEPLSIFDDARLYTRVDIDTLFYTFYFRQGTYEQYLAAKALKAQSWRFHKQYQTWFQRHEEPKSITEEYEQGTYRFFDYESTWYAYVTSYNHSSFFYPSLRFNLEIIVSKYNWQLTFFFIQDEST